MKYKLFWNQIKRRIKIPLSAPRVERDFNYHLLSTLPNYLIQILQLHANKIYTEKELPFTSTELDFLLKKDIVIRKSAIKSFYRYYFCERCLNQKQLYFSTIDCLRCQKKHVYCRKCIRSGRVMACDFLYYLPNVQQKYQGNFQPSWQGQLTAEQEKGAFKILAALKKQQDIIVWAVTGSGKTEMLYPALTYALNKGLKVCISSPRTDVIKELEHRLRPVYPNLSLGIFYKGSLKKESSAQLILSTNQQLFRFNQAFDLLIIDEVDAFPYENNIRLQEVTKRSRKIKGATVYLTATPNQLQKRDIQAGRIQSVIIKRRFHGHPLIIPRYIQAAKLTSTYQSSLKEFELWFVNRKDKSRRLLIFLPEIALMKVTAKGISEILKKHGFIKRINELETVHSEDIKRTEKVEAFRSCKTKCIITTTILERGVTFKSVDVCVMNADNVIFTQSSLIQIAGRVGRSADDPQGEVVFFSPVRTKAIKDAMNEINFMNK